MELAELTQGIRAEALRLGFTAVGVTDVASLGLRRREYLLWRDAGRAGTMQYMNHLLERQERLLSRFPNLKGILVLAAPYARGRVPSGPVPAGSGRIARYAQGRDYHRVIRKRLRRLADFIRQRAPDAVLQVSVDKGPLQEKVLAEAAGLGFFGKNSCLIMPNGGSFFFLALLLTNLDLVTDSPISWDCGSCTLCLQACPTGALVSAYQLDATRCISYLTIEHRGPIPPDLRPLPGDWLFGCDICQEVCPYNRQAHPAPHWPEFDPASGAGAFLPLDRVSAIRTSAQFLSRFAGTPLMRAKREGLLRNAELVAEGSATHPPV